MAVQAMVKALGLRRTVRLVAGPPHGAYHAPPEPGDGTFGVPARRLDGEARQAAAVVRTAATLYPFKTACLEQSLCVLWILRRVGADARLRLGVVPFPLRAHAWVEHHGVPVNEEAEVVATYRILPDLLTS
jgi:hypothetical protein